MKPPVQAAIIFALLAVWMSLGFFREPDTTPEETTFAQPALKSVRVLTLEAKDFNRPVLLRADTYAERRVPVISRTTAVVKEVPVNEGVRVREGELLCSLEEEDRRTAVMEAQAQLKSAEVDWEAVSRLVAQNLSSELDIARKDSALQNARARLERAELQLRYTRIEAPFGGIVEELPAEVGAVLQTGQPCALLLDLDPILVRGHVSEAEVDYLTIGDAVSVEFSNGEIAFGNLAFVGRSAEGGSRTFRVEAELPNPDFTIRDGLSADFSVFSSSRRAHRIPAASLMLDPELGIHVKVLADGDKVESVPVGILYDDSDGIWVSGLPEQVRLITVGHYYVADGQQVAGVEESQVGSSGISGHLTPALPAESGEERP